MENLYKIAIIVIAACNLFFTIYIFNSNRKSDKEEKECDRKINLLKTLVLDHNLQYFYKLFYELDRILQGLKKPNLSDVQKSGIDTQIADKFVIARQKFYDILLAVDVNLYEEIKNHFDELHSHISDTIFDPGINLNHEPKFREVIDNKVSTSKAEIIKTLFEYRGK